ncbi:hypothetical protein DBP18_07980 [Streptomyces sp. CS081A]|nr:hypothetical protein DBP18_07980 [Streptomyces sp. CS081A]
MDGGGLRLFFESLLAHLAGDYLIQSDCMATGKIKRWWGMTPVGGPDQDPGRRRLRQGRLNRPCSPSRH